MSIQFFLTYLSIVTIATITPGPSMLMAINHGVNHGLRKTFVSGLGNMIGNILMAIVSIIGLGALLIASGVIFNIIKWCGVAYLIYLGIMTFFASTSSKEEISEKPYKEKSTYRLFSEGFIIAIGNPKGILFFTALFPQFISTDSASISGFSFLIIPLAIVAITCYMLYAAVGTRISKLFAFATFRKTYNRIVGSIFIGTGIALAFSRK
ncbi:MAG TPA: LysE family translocator [Bacteroidales bacterium]|nr:LysE family translocator [Bacteroidales bacterium]